MCSQKCTNNKGGFECSCLPGYTVGTRDKRICVANGKLIVQKKVDNVHSYVTLYF
jgi:hypothetical protein